MILPAMKPAGLQSLTLAPGSIYLRGRRNLRQSRSTSQQIYVLRTRRKNKTTEIYYTTSSCRLLTNKCARSTRESRDTSSALSVSPAAGGAFRDNPADPRLSKAMLKTAFITAIKDELCRDAYGSHSVSRVVQGADGENDASSVDAATLRSEIFSERL